ncbi:MAG: hypothetical protein R2770_21785 [Acidimicrobiales bacterium]|nr:hypothetical protein [Acidimicrobiales bacterium]
MSSKPTLSTPRLFRLWAVLCVLAAAVAGVVGFIATSSLVSSTERIRDNSGPVLVATQDVIASVAEADAASTAVFLSGQDQDRSQRLLYEEALARSISQVEEVARLIGDDDTAHLSLKDVAANLVRYAGQVEAARGANLNAEAGADDLLRAALATVRDDIFPQIDVVAARADTQLADDGRGLVPTVLAVVAAAMAGVVMLAANGVVRRRTNRLLNPGLVVAGLMLLVFALWVAVASASRSAELDNAETGGFDTIAATARIQQAGFSYKTAEAVSIVDGRSDPGLDAQAAEVQALLAEAGALADSDREDAAVAELVVRWDRYLEVSDRVEQLLASGDASGARVVASGEGNSAFNGFNTAVESVLLDNRTQFAEGVQAATAALGYLRVASVVLAAAAALAAWFGFQARIGEYS